VSDEHEKHFHQDISSMEKRYQGKWKWAMLTDYCWTLARDVPTMEFKQQAKQKQKQNKTKQNKKKIHDLVCVK